MIDLLYKKKLCFIIMFIFFWRKFGVFSFDKCWEDNGCRVVDVKMSFWDKKEGFFYFFIY